MIAAWKIDRSLPPRHHGLGLAIVQHFHVTLEFRRTTHELHTHGTPAGYTEQHHARIRWSRFALMWAAIGAQRIVEREIES